jgi:hypothetical protein
MRKTKEHKMQGLEIINGIVEEIETILEAYEQVPFISNDVRLLNFGGIDYEYSSIEIAEQLKVNCIQVPSADMYTFPVSGEFLNQYLHRLQSFVI